MIDPELAAASVLLDRPDIRDEVASRVHMAALRENTAAFDPAAAGTVTVRDTVVPARGDDPAVPIRIYRPLRSGVLRPAVVFFHGGGFVMGDLDSEDMRCRRYAAEAGCVVVSVDYRLAPEHAFPAGLNDCYRGLVWTAEHAQDLSVDVARVAVAGSSAGGALAACVAQMARDRGGPALALQLLLYPVIDDRMTTDSMRRYADTPVWDSRNNTAMWEQYAGAAARDAPYLSPNRLEDLTGLPAAFIVVAGFDPLRDEALGYATRLLQSGIEVELHLFANAYHSFDQVVPDADISRRAVDEQVHWLRFNLRP